MIDTRSKWLGGAGIIAGAAALDLVLACVISRPWSIANGREGVLVADLALMLGCVLFSGWAWREERAAPAQAFRIGDAAGLVLGIVLVVRHAGESFGSLGGRAALVLGVGLVFAMLALFTTAGSLGRSATSSTGLGALAGLWASGLALEILLSAAFACILVFPDALADRLSEPLRASGMSDAHAYVIRNGLDSALELLTRMPLIALLASLAGAVANALIARMPRRVQRTLAWIAPCALVGGGWALYHANGVERSMRPPFVMTGVLLSALSLCVAHPIWSALRSTNPARAVPGS